MPPCSCALPCFTCEKVAMDYASTVRYENFEVVDASSKDRVGDLQFLYRGNYAGNAYDHMLTPFGNPLTPPMIDMPFKVTGYASDSKIGKLMSAVAAGRSYLIGEPKPMFSDVAPKAMGMSPGFSGWVTANDSSQVKKMLDVMGEDLVVMEDTVLHADHGKVMGSQVMGWKLILLGYGSQVKPRKMTTLQEVKDLVAVALEHALGDFSTVFNLRFQLPDPEKPIVKSGLNLFGVDSGNIEVGSNFNPPKGGYANNMMEEVHCACIMRRCWQFPCNFNPQKTIICKVPCYAQVIKDVAPGTPGGAAAGTVPVQVVMGFNKAGEAQGLRNAAKAPAMAVAVAR
jgi:hypothetical protein